MIIRSISAVKCANECVFNGAKMLKQRKKMLQIVYITVFLYYLCKVF